jgi:hypothetical protein
MMAVLAVIAAKTAIISVAVRITLWAQAEA